jgi:hypothetical protein
MNTITRKSAKEMIKTFLPLVWRESMFLGTGSSPNLPATEVFDKIRKMSDPPISEQEFNSIADSLERES